MYTLRTAGPGDADEIARLHAESWRRHYRGAFADAYLDGDVLTDRLAVWTSRLAAPSGTVTFVADDGAGLTGFVHAVLDEDARWGSFVDNLHVTVDRQRTGLGTALLTRAARAVAEQATTRPLYLWVLKQNDAAQRFYRALGGVPAEGQPVDPPGGVPDRLAGSPVKLRMVWPDVALVTPVTRPTRAGRGRGRG